MLYKGIIADPPWAYDSPSAMPTVIKKDGSIAKAVDVRQEYDTMSLDQIKAIKVPADKNCILFLWITNPKLAEGWGAEVVRAWGFRPVSVVTWAKVQADGITPSRKNGWWFRSASEHIIIADRGKVKRPPNWPALASWFPHKRMAHSVKPTVMHDIMERAVPDGPWLEMFARRSHPGWSLWGNQAPPPENL